jgi:branched-subunit amino acid aminotransferase/4-amino-4-deoxychorismate lyase
VLWSNRAGHVCEATTANVFAILKNGHLWTPQPHLDACLPGLTRRWLLRRAMPALGLQATLPGSCDVETLLPQTDGLFLTNAVCGLQAVASLDGQRFSWPAKARSIFTRLQQSWHEANCPTLGRIDSA